MKKKIAFVQPVLSPYTISRFEELAKNDDLDIYLFLEKYEFGHRPGWSAKDIKGCTIEIIGSLIKKGHVENRKLGYIMDDVRTIPYRLPLLIAKHKPDILLVCNATELFFAFLLKPILKYKIGLIVEDTIHSVEHKSWLNKKIKAISYHMADFYLPFSDKSLAYLKQIGIIDKLFRTSWSVDLKFFSKINKSEHIKILKENLKLSNKLTFIFVGQLIPLKGIMNLLEAWKSLPESIKNEIALLIIGDGPQKTKIEKFISSNEIPNIILLGQKQHKEVVNYYHAADIFILPTLKDLFSLSVMEAMACGLPILTTIYNGASELVKYGENGYLFDSANIEDIRKVVLKTVREKQRLPQMGEKSIEIIRDYSNEKVMYNFRKILQTI